jgi:hypothetical protein
MVTQEDAGFLIPNAPQKRHPERAPLRGCDLIDFSPEVINLDEIVISPVPASRGSEVKRGLAVSLCPSDLTALNKSNRPPLCHPERSRGICGSLSRPLTLPESDFRQDDGFVAVVTKNILG